MSSQLQDYFEEAVETVARTLYTRNRTPREPAWEDTDPEIRRGCIRDARAVIDLWLLVTQKCRDTRTDLSPDEGRRLFLLSVEQAKGGPLPTMEPISPRREES